MIAEGKYRARAVEAKLGYTNSGNEQVGVAFEILEGDAVGQVLTWYGYFTEKTQTRTIEALRHCGWKGTDISKLDGIDTNEVVVVVEHETDDRNQTRARIRWVNRPGSGGVVMAQPLEGAAAREFAARMRALCEATKPVDGTPVAAAAPRAQPKPAPRPAPARRAPEPEPEDDTIPF